VDSEPQNATAPHNLRWGRNVATLLQSLYKDLIVTAQDIHRCLRILMTSKPRRDRMDAIHAIITHSDEGLREGATVPEFIRGLRVRLSRRNPATQKYV
jgi:hypothetical protein